MSDNENTNDAANAERQAANKQAQADRKAIQEQRKSGAVSKDEARTQRKAVQSERQARQAGARPANTLQKRIDEDPYRESEETASAKADAGNTADNLPLDYSAGGIDNTTDIVTVEPTPPGQPDELVPAKSTRQKD